MFLLLSSLNNQKNQKKIINVKQIVLVVPLYDGKNMCDIYLTSGKVTVLYSIEELVEILGDHSVEIFDVSK